MGLFRVHVRGTHKVGGWTVATSDLIVTDTTPPDCSDIVLTMPPGVASTEQGGETKQKTGAGRASRRTINGDRRGENVGLRARSGRTVLRVVEHDHPEQRREDRAQRRG